MMRTQEKNLFAVFFTALFTALLAASPNAGADDLGPGSWMLEIYRPDAPLDTRHIRVIEADDGFVFVDTDGEVTYFEGVRVVDGAIEFRHPDFQEKCRLTARPDAEGWNGTCPPGHEPEFDAGLTITLRRPKEPSPAAAEGDADADAAGEAAVSEGAASGDEPAEATGDAPAEVAAPPPVAADD